MTKPKLYTPLLPIHPLLNTQGRQHHDYKTDSTLRVFCAAVGGHFVQWDCREKLVEAYKKILAEAEKLQDQEKIDAAVSKLLECFQHLDPQQKALEERIIRANLALIKEGKFSIVDLKINEKKTKRKLKDVNPPLDTVGLSKIIEIARKHACAPLLVAMQTLCTAMLS